MTGGAREEFHADDVAIIGMACIFPEAPDLHAYWQNIVSKVDAIGDPPPEWKAALSAEPGSIGAEVLYSTRGGFLRDLASFDPVAYGIMPRSVDGGDPDQFLAIRVAHEALADAGYLDRPFDAERTEVVLGRGTYINRGYTSVVQHALVVDQTLKLLKRLHPEHDAEDLARLRQELKANLPPFNAEIAPSLVPNIVSGRIANRLDFMGPNFTVDAACASALIALDIALRDLRTGRCDMAVVGGVHVSTPFPIHMIFCQLSAISHLGKIRPFDKNADGTILGEGLGMVVLKRRADAERDLDRIYAVVKAVGTASDGRAVAVMAPRLEGEILALRRAYEAANISPRSVGLIEAHGTGTVVGDATEIQALTQGFGPREGAAPWCAIGSVKSMIGHTLPAAGIAGLIKAALALHHKVLPPTLHCEEPDPRLGLDTTPFYVNTETRPWIHGSPDAPRRAGVNAFGFGGINAHAILEEYPVGPGVAPVSLQREWDSEVLIVSGESRADLVERARDVRAYLAQEPAVALRDLAYTLNVEGGRPEARRTHLAVVASSLADAEMKLGRALDRLSAPGTERIKDVSGIYFFAQPLGRTGKLAFLFPGEGSQYLNMLADLCLHFPEARRWFDLMDRAFVSRAREYLPSQIVFPLPTALDHDGRQSQERRLWQMDIGAEAVFTASQALLALLGELGLAPDAVVGHSTGEYSALLAAGAIPARGEQQLIERVLAVNAIYEGLAAESRIPHAVLVTVGGAPAELLASLVEDSDGAVQIAMDNCPHQVVLSATEVAATGLIERLERAGIICGVLPFNRAYHTPRFQVMSDALRGFFGQLEIVAPRVPVYSCVTAGPYPDDADEVRHLAAIQWSRRVRFRETIEAMYEAGVRIFVEVGPRNNLTAFVDDILGQKPHVALPANVPQRSGITQLNHLVGLLVAHGVPLRLGHLYARRAPRTLSLVQGQDRSVPDAGAGRMMRIQLGLAPLNLDERRPGAPAMASPSALAPAARNGIAAPAAPSADVPSTTAIQSATKAPPVGKPESGAGPELPTRAHPPEAGGRLNRRPSAASVRALRAYLDTMDAFLATQEGVMQEFLGRRASLPERPAAMPIPSTDPSWTLPVPLSSGMPGGAPHDEAPVPAPTTARPPQPERRSLDGRAVAEALLQVVSEKTGYPVEMLDPGSQMEADLGIDSIKRVEILGAFQQQTGLIQVSDMEPLSRLRTLQQILDFVSARSPADERPAAPAADLPFIGHTVSHSRGEAIVCLREIDVEEDIFLRHHTLGAQVSDFDERLTALPIMPLTMSMEMLAEAAATLMPGRCLVGMQEVRAYRWMAFDEGRLAVRITAERAGHDRVRAEVREAAGSGGSGGPPILEGILVFADRFPEPPAGGDFPIRDEQPTRQPPGRLYAAAMFHGPSFQGVVSLDRCGEDGIEATLETLAADRLFRSRSDPRFMTDPVMLDAAGQLVGFWSVERLARGFNVFPYQVRSLDLYGPSFTAGERVKARARIALVGDTQTCSDIDVIGPDGRLRMRLLGWEDRRFDMPDSLYRLRISPRSVLIGEPWPVTVAALDGREAIECRRVAGFSDEFLDAGGGIWRRVLAHLVLSRTERTTWCAVGGQDAGRNQWLLGRIAAKDAVRAFAARHLGLPLCAADVEIVTDDDGRPEATGPWTQRSVRSPLVSLSHVPGLAVAAAADAGRYQGVGIDIERLGRVQGDFVELAFGRAERGLLESMGPAQGEWALRCWCAKEALAKALGRGFLGDPQALVVKEIDQGNGRVRLTLAGQLAAAFPHYAKRTFAADTEREGDVIVGIAVIERAAS